MIEATTLPVPGGDQPLLAVVVHRLDQRLETLVHQLALHLARRRHRLALFFRIERLGQNAERLDLLDARELALALSISRRISRSTARCCARLVKPV